MSCIQSIENSCGYNWYYNSAESDSGHLIFVDGRRLLQWGGGLLVKWLPFINLCAAGFG